MRKGSSLSFMIILLLLSSCGGPFSSISSMLVVVEKGYSENQEEYWIEAYDPNNQTKAEAINIVVHEEMVWNLIEEDKEYFTTCSKEGDEESRILEQIEHSEGKSN